MKVNRAGGHAWHSQQRRDFSVRAALQVDTLCWAAYKDLVFYTL